MVHSGNGGRASSENLRREESGSVIGISNESEAIRRIRAGFEEHLRVNFQETGLLSRAEAESQRHYVEQALQDRSNIADLLKSYASSEAHQAAQENLRLYQANIIKPLDDALEARVISSKSYGEWIAWLRDSNRDALEKKKSARGTLPEYLAERWQLAHARAKVLEDPRLKDVADAKLKAEISFLKDDSEYLEMMSFTQRKNLVDRVRAGLAVMEGGEKYRELYVKAEALLIEATRSPQPALHRDKVGTWLRRIFESGATPAQIHAFLTGDGPVEGKSLPELIQIWRSKAIQFWTLRKHPAFEGIKISFVDTKAFLWKLFDKEDGRVAYVEWMKSQVMIAQALRARATAAIGRSAQALDEGGRERWLTEYVFNGKYDLSELQSIISGNLAVRLENKVKIVRRYDAAFAEAKKSQGARGMSLLERSAFLRLHYEQQEAKTVELEQRLRDFRRQKPDFLLIRHLMDREDWEGASALIQEARKRPGLLLDDDAQLHSMERTIALHRKEETSKEGNAGKELSEVNELDLLLESIHSPGLKRMCIDLCNRGSESIGALGWTCYNRDWCNRNGYLNEEREEQAVRKGKAAALAKERRKRRGVVSETIQGETAEKEYVELSHNSATNVCVDLADDAAIRAYSETMHLKRKDHRALYWTNAIFHYSGALLNLEMQREETQKMYTMRNLLRKLEAKGIHYSHRRTKHERLETASKVKIRK